MKSKNVKTGQVVALKSGGPYLTIANVIDDGDEVVIECIQFVDDINVESYMFRPSMVQLLTRIEE